MIDFALHKRALVGMALALAIACLTSFGLTSLKATLHTQSLAAHTAAAKANADLHQLQEDIEATRQLKTQMSDSEALKTLAPLNRQRAARLLERLASAQTIDSFSYILSPETGTSLDSLGAGRLTFATSTVTLSGTAATDRLIYRFWDSVQHTMPGRMTLKNLTIERTEAALELAPVRFTLVADWLSNGSAAALTQGQQP